MAPPTMTGAEIMASITKAGAIIYEANNGLRIWVYTTIAFVICFN